MSKDENNALESADYVVPDFSHLIGSDVVGELRHAISISTQDLEGLFSGRSAADNANELNQLRLSKADEIRIQARAAGLSESEIEDLVNDILIASRDDIQAVFERATAAVEVRGAIADRNRQDMINDAIAVQNQRIVEAQANMQALAEEAFSDPEDQRKAMDLAMAVAEAPTPEARAEAQAELDDFIATDSNTGLSPERQAQISRGMVGQADNIVNANEQIENIRSTGNPYAAAQPTANDVVQAVAEEQDPALLAGQQLAAAGLDSFGTSSYIAAPARPAGAGVALG